MIKQKIFHRNALEGLPAVIFIVDKMKRIVMILYKTFVHNR